MDLLSPGMTDGYDPDRPDGVTPDYVSRGTIAQHQSANPDLYRQHNPAGRYTDLTRQDSGFANAHPSTSPIQYHGENALFADDSGGPTFVQRLRNGVRDFLDGVEAQKPEEREEENEKEEPVQYSAPLEQPYTAQEPTYAKSPATPLGTHTIHGYGASGAIRTPGTRGLDTDYDVWGG